MTVGVSVIGLSVCPFICAKNDMIAAIEAIIVTDPHIETCESEPEYFGQRADNAGARRVRRSFRYTVAACVLFAGTLWYADGYKRLELRETQYRMALTEEQPSARAVLRNVVRRDKESNAQPNVKYIEALAAVEEVDRVLPCYEEAYRLHAEDPWLAINYGCRLFLQAQYKEARDRFREAGIHAPKNALPRYLEAAALAMQGASQGTPEAQEESLRQALGMVERTNAVGDPVLLPPPLWHATLPARGYWYERLRRELAQSACAPLYRMKDLAIRGLSDKADKGDRGRAWLDAIDRLGIQLSGSLESPEATPTPPQCIAGLQFRLDVNRIRQAWAQSRTGAVDAALTDEGQRLERALATLQRFEDGNLEAMVADRALLMRPFFLCVGALLLLGSCYTCAFVLTRLWGADRRSWALVHPRAVYWVAGGGLLFLFILLSAHPLARALHLPVLYFRGFAWLWVGCLAGLTLFGVIYVVRQTRQTCNPGQKDTLSLPYHFAAVLSLARRYFGILLGGFLCVYCIWATSHRLVEGLYPWQITLLLDGQESESLRLLRAVYGMVAGATGRGGG